MPSEDGTAHRLHAPMAEVDEVDAVAGRECANRRLVDAEPSVRSTSVGVPDEAPLGVAHRKSLLPGTATGSRGPLCGSCACSAS